MLDTLAWELRAAARMLLRNLGSTLAGFVVLSLGIGMVSAMSSVVEKVLLEPLPYREPERLVQLITTSRVGEERLSSIPKFLVWHDATSSFESMAAADAEGPEVNFTQGHHRVAFKAGRVSPDYFHLLGARLSMGRTFSGTEDRPNGPKAVVISDAFWRRYLHTEPNFIAAK